MAVVPVKKLPDALTCCGFGGVPASAILIHVECNICSFLRVNSRTPEIGQETPFSHCVLHFQDSCRQTAYGQVEEVTTTKAKRESLRKRFKATPGGYL